MVVKGGYFESILTGIFGYNMFPLEQKEGVSIREMISQSSKKAPMNDGQTTQKFFAQGPGLVLKRQLVLVSVNTRKIFSKKK